MFGLVSFRNTLYFWLILSIYVTSANKTLEDIDKDPFFKEQEENLEKKESDKSKRELSKIQSTLINVLKPIPVVDTIREEEKYGNTGDKFNRLGRGVVGGVETIANLINSAINFPMEAVKKLSRSATEALNNLGGKLVGLQ